MSTQITLTQVRSVVDIDPPNGVYRFRLQSSVVVDDPSGGFTEPEVFLMNKDTGDFEHTCTLGDYLTYPNAPGAEDFYRDDSILLDFEYLDDAVAESNLQKTRLQNLVTDYENYADNNWGGPPPGTTENTIISGD
jgi:hypothetical protein